MYVLFPNRCNGHLDDQVHLSGRPSRWQHLRLQQQQKKKKKKKLGAAMASRTTGDFNAQTSSTHHLSGLESIGDDQDAHGDGAAI